MAKFEAVSHYERLHNPARLQKDKPKRLTEPMERRVLEEVEDKGVIVKRVVWKSENPSDKFKGLKVSDFALENIIAAGAEGMLKDCSLGYTTPGETADSIGESVAAIEQAIVEEQNNAQNHEGQ